MAQFVRISVTLDRQTHAAAKQAARQLRQPLTRFVESLVIAEVLQNGATPGKKGKP
jgi:hypothetical protein